MKTPRPRQLRAAINYGKVTLATKDETIDESRGLAADAAVRPALAASFRFRRNDVMLTLSGAERG